MTRPSSPTGPRACVLPVEIPTSVPSPYRVPSAKRVEALTKQFALSSPRAHADIDDSVSVTIESVWCELCELMCLIASSTPDTVLTAIVGPRNSVK